MAEPYCLAMVLCDAIHRDQATGKFTLLGTFSTLGANEYPAQVQCVVYFAITDGMGDVSVSIRIVDSEADLTDKEGSVVFESPAMPPISFVSPLMVLEGAFPLITIKDGIATPLEIPNPGVYHCELYANTQLLMSRRLLAIAPSLEEHND
jgi:hypothetical protein